MTQNEILEGNKLITVFMGAEIIEPIGNSMRNIKFQTVTHFLHVHNENKLQYHSSWDWLMPVIEKIEQFDNGVCSVLITGNACDIAFSTKYNMKGEDYDAPNFIKIKGSKIGSAWSTVVDFIKWHNSLNHKI